MLAAPNFAFYVLVSRDDAMSFLIGWRMRAKRKPYIIYTIVKTLGVWGGKPHCRVGGKRWRMAEDEVDLRSRLLRHGIAKASFALRMAQTQPSGW